MSNLCSMVSGASAGVDLKDHNLESRICLHLGGDALKAGLSREADRAHTPGFSESLRLLPA